MTTFERAEHLTMGICLFGMAIFSTVKGMKARAAARAKARVNVVGGRSTLNKAPREKIKSKDWRKSIANKILTKRFNRSGPSVKQKNRMAVEALDRDGGHSRADHGSQVTESQHEIRLKTGRTPGGSVRAIPEASSSFLSDDMHLKAYLDAIFRLATEKINSKGGLKKQVELRSKPLSGAGIQYSLDANGFLKSAMVNSYTAIFVLDVTTGNYSLITLYPE